MLDILLNFMGILTDLRAGIAAHAARDRASTALLVLTHGRIGRLGQRFQALFNRWRTGTLPAPRPSRAGKPRKAREYARLPGRQAWLIQVCAGHVNCSGGQLQYWLDHPDLPAFLAAAPQAGRILRPLARMLAVPQPAYLQRPKPPRRAARAPRPAPSKPATPPRPLSRKTILGMSAAELTAYFAPLPPHFPLAIPHLRLIRRKIAAG